MMMAIECRRGDMEAAMEVLDTWHQIHLGFHGVGVYPKMDGL